MINFTLLKSQSYYRIFFKDKGPLEFAKGNELYNATLNSLSKKSIERRAKVLSDTISYEDVNIYKPYLDSISNLKNVELIHKLKWLNYILVKMDSSKIEMIKSFAFVKKIVPATSKFEVNSLNLSDSNSDIYNLMGNQILLNEELKDSSFYGGSFLQVSSLNVDFLHRMGITGESILMGFLDSGFRWKTHKSMHNSKVIAEYDFIQRDFDTSNDSLDKAGQDGHGTLVMSVVGGYDEGKLIGVAPDAKFVLAKTEDIRDETSIEEDNYAAAIEWMDSIGVELINASLGYRAFDSNYYDYTFVDLDGNTTLSSKYVNMAVSKGIVFFNAAGNNGIGYGTINSPADADLVISVGSIDSNLVDVSNFSSRGPNAKNVFKPEFVAFGNRPVCAAPNDSLKYTVAKGTSLASPLLAGSVSLILSTFPEIKPNEIKEILKGASDNSSTPDNNKGFGLPDIYGAMINYDIVISPINYYQSQNFVRVVVYIAYKSSITSSSLFIKFNGSNDYEEYNLRKGKESNQYFCDILTEKFKGEIAEGFIIANSTFKGRRFPFKGNENFRIDPKVDKINRIINIKSLPNIFVQESKSFVYPTIVNKSNLSLIEVNIFNKGKNAEVVLFDSFGNIIEFKKINEINENISKLNFNISKLSIGAYFIGVFTENNKEILKFLIID